MTRIAFWNTLASGIDIGSRTLLTLLTTPILVLYLGQESFGIWKVLQRLVGYFGESSGVRPTHMALRNVIASQQQSNDLVSKQQSVASAIVMWLPLIPLQLCGIMGLVWFSPLWLGVAHGKSEIVRMAGAFLALQQIVVSLSGVAMAVLEGENQAYRRAFLSAPLMFFNGILLVVAAISHTGLVGVAAAVLVGSLINGIAYFMVCRAHVPWFGVRWPAYAKLKDFFGVNAWFLAWRLVRKLMTTSDVIILGIFASPALVTTYALTRQIPEILVNITAMLGTGVTPGMGSLLGAGELEKIRRLRVELMLITWLAVVSIGSGIILWNKDFIGLWVGQEYFAGQSTTLLIVIMITQFVVLRNDANIIDLTLDLQRKVLVSSFSVCLSLAFSIGLLIKGWGVDGLCVGFILGRLPLNVYFPLLVAAKLGSTFRQQLWGCFRTGFVGALMFTGANWLSQRISVTNWLEFAAGVSASYVIILGVLLVLGLTSTQRETLIKRVRKLSSQGAAPQS